MQPNQTIFYVQDIPTSVALYTNLLKREPVESHPDYVCFQLDSGYFIGFWLIDDVIPSATTTAPACELFFELPNKQAVDACLNDWQQYLTIIQPPENLCFGYTFTAVDNDNIRLRVCATNTN